MSRRNYGRPSKRDQGGSGQGRMFNYVLADSLSAALRPVPIKLKPPKTMFTEEEIKQMEELYASRK